MRITKEKGFVQPSVYQGMYNLIARAGEAELFPLLRKHNISFYAYRYRRGEGRGGVEERGGEEKGGRKGNLTYSQSSCWKLFDWKCTKIAGSRERFQVT